MYVHAKLGIVDDEWMTIGSANLNEHSLFNDTEVNVATDDRELIRDTRLRLWAEHLRPPGRRPVDGDPTDVVDNLWRPTAEEQAAPRTRRRAPHPPAHAAPRACPAAPAASRARCAACSWTAENSTKVTAKPSADPCRIPRGPFDASANGSLEVAMSTSVLDMSMSLDGYIADEHDFLGGHNGERLHDWFDSAEEGPSGEFEKEWNSAGAVVAGRRTAELMDHWGGSTTASRSSCPVTGHPARQPVGAIRW